MDVLIQKNKKIVLIGGGTGNSTLLKTLKYYTDSITAIVTVGDDGGSSGTIRKEMGILPPGDIRNCLISLANKENIMADLMNYRFSAKFMDSENLGNLMIAAMTDITGSFPLAIKQISEVLAIKGKVLPVSLDEMVLSAVLSDGNTVKGESQIPLYCKANHTQISKISLDNPHVELYEDCRYAIEDADHIILSPGSLYTSLIPNLLVDGMVDALLKSNARKTYVVNLMTQSGETFGYDLSKHIQSIELHANGEKIIDEIIYNVQDVPEYIVSKYKAENSHIVKNTFDYELKNEYQFIPLNLVSIKNDILRHNSKNIWEYIIDDRQ